MEDGGAYKVILLSLRLAGVRQSLLKIIGTLATLNAVVLVILATSSTITFSDFSVPLLAWAMAACRTDSTRTLYIHTSCIIGVKTLSKMTYSASNL